MEKTQIAVDTRSYNRRDFVWSLVHDTCGAHLDSVTAQECVEFIDEQCDIVDFDGEVMSAGRWINDITAILEQA